MSHQPTPISSLFAACDAVFALDAPAIVGLVATAGGWRLSEEFGFDDPDDLIGLVAPRSWEGIALVATGRSRDIDNGSVERLRLTYALHRDGAYASTLTTPSGTRRVDPDHDDAPVGRLADYTRRILGLPTAPESVQPSDLSAELDHQTWDQIHADVVDTGIGFFGLLAAQVEWFDGPSFGRLVMSMIGVPDGAARGMANVTDGSAW